MEMFVFSPSLVPTDEVLETSDLGRPSDLCRPSNLCSFEIASMLCGLCRFLCTETWYSAKGAMYSDLGRICRSPFSLPKKI